MIRWFKYGGGAFDKVVENMSRYAEDYNGPDCYATCNSSPGYWPNVPEGAKKVWFGGHNYNKFLKNRIKGLSIPDLIVAFSPFCAQTYRDLGFTAYDGILGADTSVYKPNRIDGDKFTFLSNCWCEGYGVNFLLEGWGLAAPHMKGAELVIKTHYDSERDLNSLREKISGIPKVRIFEPVGWSLNDHDLAKFFNTGDCFVCVVPSGGSSLTILEAMACGLPVIGPQYSGYAPFITNRNGYPVEYSLKPVPNAPHLADGAVWAEVGIEDLADKMIQAYTYSGICAEKGKRSARFVAENHTWEMAAKHFHRIVEGNL